MRALYVVAGLWSAVAFADPPLASPDAAVAPGSPPLAAPDPSPAKAPAPSPAVAPPLQLLEIPYPEALADRPITLLPGMTELLVDYQFSSTVLKTFGNRTPDTAARHAFGPVELDLDVGYLATFSAAFATGAIPAVIRVGADSGVPQNDNSLHEAQFVEIDHKIHLVPGMCAAFFGAGAGYNENRIVNNSSMLVWTHVLLIYLDAEFELQILPNVALDVGVSYNLPTAMSDEVHFVSSYNASATLTATIAHSWDIYVNGSLGDVGNERLPNLSFGFLKRWGG